VSDIDLVDGVISNSTSSGGLLSDTVDSGELYVSPHCSDSDIVNNESFNAADELIVKAYGAPLLHSDGGECNNAWCQRWAKVIHHTGNHYILPGGATGRHYVDVLTEEVKQLAAGNYSSERVLVFSAVILQRDRMVCTGSDVRRLIERRLTLWKEGSFDILLQEADRCNCALRRSHTGTLNKTDIVRVFTRLMLQGKVRAAVRWATERATGNVLLPSTVVNPDVAGCQLTVMDVLRQKHPAPSTPALTALLPCDSLPEFEDVEATGSHVLLVAHRIQGGAGPGGCDAGHWKDVLLRYGGHSSRLRDAVATLARRLLNNIIPWDSIRALVANRLIALDKCPGVRPIGIGETLRRIIGKVVCLATRIDAELVCGTDQLCGGVKCGIEGAVHAMNDLFTMHSDSTPAWGVLLVDASNAFNTINRVALLWNVRILWPRCSRFIFNTYQGWAALVVRGSEESLFSREGVTQGDPLSMFLYAIGTIPLIRSLNGFDVRQIWYADDASGCGRLADVRKWFDFLCQKGPDFGYFVNPSKCCLVVDRTSLTEAQCCFSDLGIQIVCSQRYLGGFLGESVCRTTFVEQKVKQWTSHVHCLAEISMSQPQAAFAALTKSLQCEWRYLQRVVPDCGDLFAPLQDALFGTFLPAVFGCDISLLEQQLFSLPVRFGGLGVFCPLQTAGPFHSASKASTRILVSALLGDSSFELATHEATVLSARQDFASQSNNRFEQHFKDLLCQFDNFHQRVILRARANHLSGWLTSMPTAQDHFDLTSQEFRDALAVRYKKPLLGLPPTCDGCGAPSSLDHALVCRRGGLIIQRHNEVRDAIGDIAALAWRHVHREPVVCEASSEHDALIADLGIRGVWQPQAEALFDIRVTDTDAQSYQSRTPQLVLASAEEDKKRKYSDSCANRRASFTPLCFSVDGLLGGEAEVFLKRLANRLFDVWDRSFSDVVRWIRLRLAFALLRAVAVCLRGSRTKWRSLGVEDGAAIKMYKNSD